MADTVRTTSEPTAPVVLRASPRVIITHLRLGALFVVLATLGWWLRLTSLPLCLAVAAVGQFFWWMHGAVGRVELRSDAVRIRRLVGVTTVGLRDVSRFVVRTTSFGRHVRLERHFKRTLRLPGPVSPRLLPDNRFDEQVEAIRTWCRSEFGGAAGPAPEGRRPRWAYPAIVLLLVVAAALPDRPWGWVATAEASDIPQPCTALQQQAADVAGPAAGEPLVLSAPELQVTGCRWAVGPDRDLVVVMSLYSRSGLHSGESVATTQLLAGGPGAAAWSTGTLQPLPHASRLGDASLTAYFGQSETNGSPTGAVVVARKSNVIVQAYLGPRSDGTVQAHGPLGDSDVAGLLTVVRTALASVAVR